jgi:hypothetical protein
MRELDYAVEGKAANLKTFAMDEPGHGGACHEYQIERAKSEGPDKPETEVLCDINFQNGPIDEGSNGVNGVQHEDLLAIIIDRLQGFESGPYSCEENAQALMHCEEALRWLNTRTKNRIARKVEGTHTV